ncbi:hypothetical protein AGMMS49965_24630 [Bacteroidia bacterium]|nr:hypothetical protein AGMMS49965_24630 [Bacteroidia bacterium]
MTKVNGHFLASAYLQNLCCYEGAKEVFEAGSATLALMLGIDVTGKEVVCAPRANTSNPPEETYYAMMDGAMIFTRTEQWKEVKLGRCFSSLDHYLRNTQILDYFHAKEHLCEFAECCFADMQEKRKWVSQQEDILLKDGVKVVINNILQLPVTTDAQQKKQNALVKYYQTNLKRMRYGTFRKRGLLIGSGPIESANRTVIQHRLKLSGQR